MIEKEKKSLGGKQVDNNRNDIVIRLFSFSKENNIDCMFNIVMPKYLFDFPKQIFLTF